MTDQTPTQPRDPQRIFAWVTGETATEILMVQTGTAEHIVSRPMLFPDLRTALAQSGVVSQAADQLQIPIALREFELTATHATVGPA